LIYESYLNTSGVYTAELTFICDTRYINRNTSQVLSFAVVTSLLVCFTAVLIWAQYDFVCRHWEWSSV